MADLRLGRGQIRIMQELWEKKRATAQEITDAINEVEHIKHSTVQTFLRMLVKKKAVAFDVDHRTFIYYPLISKEKVTQKELHEFMDVIFKGSPEGMISYIIKNTDISHDQIKKIKKLLEEEK
ncbi:MAG: BlaI/MecI/CopY family transcriptional regulator [Candidatus Latescibacteria bacterium]|nr:BlaI/MecI/CopY family transcriptional regulator [Candidatus Latescibacterota bacterium]